MSFGQPWFLLGMLAGLIPLAVHLFDRRKARPQPFAAISFVLRSQRRTASRLKLKRLVLYTLRTLILLAIPLALARPEVRRPGTQIAHSAGPAATALVVDRSLAMRFQDGQSLFDKARSEARSALASLGPEDPVTVVPCGPDPVPPAAPGLDRSAARETVDRMRPAWAGADLGRCLDLAARALEDSPIPGKRLVVISAFTAGVLRLEAPPPTLRGPGDKRIRPEMVLRDVARGRKVLPNHYLADLKAEPAPQAGGRSVQVSFTVRNVSETAAREVPATVELGGRVVAKTFLELAAGGTAQKTLTVRAESGGAVAGAVSLSPDGLAEDDRRDFVVHVPRELRVLVVDGAPSSVRYRDEVFFLEAALGAPSSPVRPTLRDPEAGLRERLEAYDVAVLANVSAPSTEEASRLRAFVEGGGGLFISMGDRVDPEPWTARMGELLPRPLRLVKTAGGTGETEGRLARLGDVHWEHPLFAPFAGRAREGLLGARFSKYMLVEGGTRADGSEVLATYDDGAPAFLTARRGRGRVLLFTGTVDRDWGDFAIRTSYLPLVQRAVAWLAAALDERETVAGRVGQTLALRPDPQAQVTQVRAPSGEEVPVRLEPDRSLVVGPLPEPGLYRTFDPGGQLVASSQFPAVLDPADSDLTRLDEGQLQAYFGEEAVRGPASSADRRVPLWTWLVVAAAAAFFCEGLLLRKP